MKDIIADNTYQVELQVFIDEFKLYIHKDGEIIVRMCKLKAEQISIPIELVDRIV